MNTQTANIVSFPAKPVEHDHCPSCGAINSASERRGTGICNECLDKRIARERAAEAQAQSERRALELAEAHHLIGSAIYRGTRTNCETVELFSVRSVSAGSIYHGRHTVEHDLVTGAISCDCPAGQHNRPCGHYGSVLAYLHERAGLMAQLAREAAAEIVADPSILMYL